MTESGFLEAVVTAQAAIDAAQAQQALIEPAWQRLAELSVEADLGKPDRKAEEAARKQIADGELAVRKLPILQGRLTEALETYKQDRLATLQARRPEVNRPRAEAQAAVKAAETELERRRRELDLATATAQDHGAQIRRLSDMDRADLLRIALQEAARA